MTVFCFLNGLGGVGGGGGGGGGGPPAHPPPPPPPPPPSPQPILPASIAVILSLSKDLKTLISTRKHRRHPELVEGPQNPNYYPQASSSSLSKGRRGFLLSLGQKELNTHTYSILITFWICSCPSREAFNRYTPLFRVLISSSTRLFTPEVSNLLMLLTLVPNTSYISNDNSAFE
jgi:hypothetical protein